MVGLLRITQLLGTASLAVAAKMVYPDPEPFLAGRQLALTQDSCATVNTASGAANTSDFQTNGLCKDFCTQRNAAFAIVQWQSCWCSNVAPSSDDTGSVGDCDHYCPGYDSENCGKEPNHYGYINLGRDPTSTQGSGGASSTTTTPDPTTTTTQKEAPPPPPVTETSIVIIRPSPTPSSESESSEVSSTTSESSPTTSAQTTVTKDGTVRTVFVTPSAEPDSSDTNAGTDATSDSANSGEDDSSDSDSGPGTGAVVGIVVGVIVGVLAAAGIILFLWFRRKRQRQESDDKYDEPMSSQRGSSAGMISASRNPDVMVSEWEPDATSEQRRSRLMAIDPRMDPRTMYARNKSHESINTIHDDHDYSRKVSKPVLRATNPDPET